MIGDILTAIGSGTRPHQNQRGRLEAGNGDRALGVREYGGYILLLACEVGTRDEWWAYEHL